MLLLWVGRRFILTTPDATSSLCAVAADFTNAPVAAAMAFAASKICSSKANDSSACYRITQHNGYHLSLSNVPHCIPFYSNVPHCILSYPNVPHCILSYPNVHHCILSYLNVPPLYPIVPHCNPLYRIVSQCTPNVSHRTLLHPPPYTYSGSFSWFQFSQLSCSGFNGRCSTQEFILGDHIRILGIHPVGA